MGRRQQDRKAGKPNVPRVCVQQKVWKEKSTKCYVQVGGSLVEPWRWWGRYGKVASALRHS